MNKEKSDQLKRKFPKLFENAQEPFLSEGFRFDDGWYDIIHDMCSMLNTVVIEEELEFVIMQMKEKFGELRMYTIGGTDITEKIIDFTWERSRETCERCGSKGKVRKAKWCLQCLCDNCLQDVMKEERV